MKTLTAIVENGTITLPPNAAVPDGSLVQIVWDEGPLTPFEGRPWTTAELQADLEWAEQQEPQP